MATPDNLVLIYKELADWHERQGQPQMRDRFLVLAADAAQGAGRRAEADLLLGRLLRANPHHMLRPFASFAEALASTDIQSFVAELRRTHPPEQAEQQFDQLRSARAAAGGRPTRALPPTAPVVDLDRKSEPAGGEPLKVYRVQEEAEVPAPRATRPMPTRVPSSPPRSAHPWPVAADPASPRPATDPDEGARGGLVSLVLSVVLLLAGVALAARMFLGPFWH